MDETVSQAKGAASPNQWIVVSRMPMRYEEVVCPDENLDPKPNTQYLEYATG